MSSYDHKKSVENKNARDVHYGDNNIYHVNEKPLQKIVTIGSAPSPSKHFLGRKDDIAKIKAKSGKLILVNGMGGIGKTEICKNLFAEYSKTHSAVQHVGWVVFDRNLKNTLYGKFIATREIADFEKNYIQTKIHINDLSDKLVLFIDNMNEISKEDKTEINSLACNVIITSRQLTHDNNIEVVEIGVLTEDDCVSLYEEVLGRKNYDHEVVKHIVQKGACLTLVVELLAKTAKRARLTDDELLEKLNKNGFDLSEIKHTVDDDKSFNECLSKLFDLSKIGTDELLVLKQFSLFPPQPLDYEYAEKWFGQDNPDILNILIDKGWLIDTGTGIYMHHVMADVVKYENMPSYQECVKLVEMLAKDLYCSETEIFTDKLPLLPFSVPVAQRFVNDKDENIALLLHTIAVLYKKQSDYDKALKYYKKALAIKKVLGKTHPSTATIYNNMAGVFEAQGEYSKALEYYEKALGIYEKVLGKTHPSTARTYNNMAGVFKAQGEYSKALEYCEKSLAIKEKVLGKAHPSTARTYNNMAEVFKAQEEYSKALEYHEKALEIDEKVLGKTHPLTAITYNNMALVFANQENYDKALEWYLRSIKILLNILGREHPNTVTVFINMKYAYTQSGKTSDFTTWLIAQLNKEESTHEPI
ncbi:MAG: DUF2225 domain-containing protein [Defluviitaleaceae bacterium]|nr:DUF2225 domain-containing protein [Defluviitaleaceae bacterium]